MSDKHWVHDDGRKYCRGKHRYALSFGKLVCTECDMESESYNFNVNKRKGQAVNTSVCWENPFGQAFVPGNAHRFPMAWMSKSSGISIPNMGEHNKASKMGRNERALKRLASEPGQKKIKDFFNKAKPHEHMFVNGVCIDCGQSE